MLERLDTFESRFVESRHIDVWLPPGYVKGGGERYPVIYLQDGQYNCLPASNVMGWGLCDTVAGLIEEGTIPPVILANIWNSSDRWREYVPKKPVDRFASPEEQMAIRKRGKTPTSDRYLRFFIEELIPHMESIYPLITRREGRYLMGSSLGGIISLYAVCEHPHLFSGAGCLSSHWPLYEGSMLPYMEEALPDPALHRFYFDISTEALDAQYPPYHHRVQQILTQKGYREHETCMNLVWQGHDHSATSWGKRVHVPLTFLLNPDISWMNQRVG